MHCPKISVVTPSFNQGKYLEKTILSVLEQNYPNLEYIIIDGGSTDNSVEIIKKYEKHLHYWVSEKDRGQSHAINKGFPHATGELFAWLNSDDYYAPGALHAVADLYRHYPDAGAFVGAGEMTDGTSTSVREPFAVTVDALYGWIDRYFMQPSCFFTKRAWEVCGPLSEELTFAMDLDLWLKIASKFDFACTDGVLSTSLVHTSAKTTAFAAKSIVEAAMVIIHHGGETQIKPRMEGFLQTLYEKEQRIIEYNDMVIRCQEENNGLKKTLNGCYEQIDQYKQQMHGCEQRINQLDHEINSLINSASWKVTSPLRKAGTLLQSFKNKK